MALVFNQPSLHMLPDFNSTALSDHQPNGALEQLAAMFPDLESDILAQLLAHNDNDVERAALALLDVGVTDAEQQLAEADASAARRMQQESDEEMAKALQASLEEEEKAEEERRKQEALPAVAARAVNSAKTWLAKVRAPGAANFTSTHSTRLLETPLDVSDLPYDMSPLSPTYTPPAAVAAESPPPPAAALIAPTCSGAPTAAALAPADSSARYNSRLARARESNRARSQSLTSTPAVEASLAPLQMAVPQAPAAAQPQVPVGELI